MIVLLPEGLTAMKAARRNRLQTSLNASLGSALASIGLTIPIAAVASVLLGVPLVLGLDGESMVLLTLTLFVASLTLSTGRTTVLQGAVHLVIFCVFVFLVGNSLNVAVAPSDGSAAGLAGIVGVRGAARRDQFLRTGLTSIARDGRSRVRRRRIRATAEPRP